MPKRGQRQGIECTNTESGPEPKPRAAIFSKRTIELPWEAWRTVIAILLEKGLPYLLEHTDRLERQPTSTRSSDGSAQPHR